MHLSSRSLLGARFPTMSNSSANLVKLTLLQTNCRQMTSSSYFLERDGLGSGRRVIDANSNATLLPWASHLTYRSSYGTTSPLPYTTNTSYAHLGYGSSSSAIETSDAKKMLAELQDQMRLLRKDMEKKDALIQELSSIRDATKIERLEPIKYEPLPAHERAALDAARRELDQCRTKLEGVSFELRETTIKLSGKDERINELKHEIESLRREFDLVNQGNQQLRVRVHELESNVNCYDSVANKSSITITSLQKEAKEKQEQLIDLQARVRTHMEEREASERKTESLYKKLQEVFTRLNITVGMDLGQPGPASFDLLMTKISEWNTENINLRGRMTKLEEVNRSFDMETQANRATIQQMANQLHVYEQNNVTHLLQIDTIRAERDAALMEKTAMRTELEAAKARLDSIHKAWQNTRGELDQRESKYSSFENHVKQVESELLYAKSTLDAFKQQVAQLLSDGFVKVEPKEDEIREKIQLLMQSSKDRGAIITNLQNQKEQLSKQLQEQIDQNKDLEGKRRQLDNNFHEMEHRVKSLNTDYTSNEAYRETLKQDKAKFLHFLERLAIILKIENVSNDLGYELNPDVILTRAEQLMRLEKDSIVDHKSTIANLQRKMQQMKEQLENKDLHLDLLRKKVVSFEESRASKTDLEREIDDHVMLSRKMKVKVDHLSQQVTELRHENTQLKAQITDVQTLKGRLVEQDKEIRRLLESLHGVEGVRDKQAVKISSLQDKIHYVDDDANRTLRSSDNTIRALSNEVRFLKSSLEQLTDRERRLLDFRSLVARMLGLDAKALSVPDYEITTRLEQLIAAVQPALAIPVIPVSSHQIHTRHRSPSPVSRRSEASHRARSLSPLHVGVDPRTY